MIINENPMLLLAVDKLRAKFNYFREADLFLGQILVEINLIDRWVYSTGDNLNFQPYLNEISGRKSGRILKKRYYSFGAAKSSGVYSHGFCDDLLKLTIYPTEVESQLPISYYFKDDDYNYNYNVDYVVSNGVVVKVSPLGLVGSFCEGDFHYFINVGSAREYLITAYQYQNGLVTKAFLWGDNWKVQGERRFNYGERSELISITALLKDGSEKVVWSC